MLTCCCFCSSNFFFLSSRSFSCRLRYACDAHGLARAKEGVVRGGVDVNLWTCLILRTSSTEPTYPWVAIAFAVHSVARRRRQVRMLWIPQKELAGYGCKLTQHGLSCGPVEGCLKGGQGRVMQRFSRSLCRQHSKTSCVAALLRGRAKPYRQRSSGACSYQAPAHRSAEE